MTPVGSGGSVCLPNISAPERRRRLIGGVVSSGLALGVLGVLLTKRVDQRWRLGVFPLFWGASVGFFQWRDKTWVRLAARGTRKTGNAEEKISDVLELAQVRGQARRVNIESTLSAVALTLLAVLLPR